MKDFPEAVKKAREEGDRMDELKYIESRLPNQEQTVRDYATEIIDQITEAAGYEHPENWSRYDYAIKEIACAAQAEIDELRNIRSKKEGN